MYSPVNYLAVLVAGLLPMLIGSFWYGPLFGKKWMSLMGKTEEELRASFNPAKSYGVTFVFALILAYMMAHVLGAWNDAYDVTGAMTGIQGAFWMWLGFVVTISWQQVAFSDQKVSLWILNILYNLVSLMAMGALLGSWN
ncbi:MAG: DUF1761 domain-containing protein [Bacteroidetes Order II. Incertae sedis bacterium]|jgi:hypothetical protein|nr:DUF1761 domain-containing protein [Bacteroidetes Order II. bacterium]MBT4052935.1 DUF1761 domain-containing protein [Bacteroidetes Order II. bacterium]MBT4602885.1 DUF1761 domain-containing protein [Bacteroidetes Order II. bacterium]MBT5249868.1 DUF1761 domain-containing protein [Bacteroidetes Order II. bacterium]MBT6199287.1 DUF1761 domain-containing protein [Bacteroidetes Order II. bacterium]